MLSNRLILWCLDGVLIPEGPFDTENLTHVCCQLIGEPCELEFSAGYTVPGIVRQTLRRGGLAGAELESKVAQAAVLLAERIRDRRAELIAADRVPGATEALLAVRSRGGVTQSLLSADVREAALAKASVLEFDQYLDAIVLGGYGADADQFVDLVEASLGKFRARYGEEPTTSVVARSPAHVTAGVRAGVCVIGVAGEPARAAALVAAGADYVLPGLTNSARVLAAIDAGPVI